MNEYQRRKDEIRNMAAAWQAGFEHVEYSYGDLANWQYYFETMGRRYGLLKEFRENGII